MLLSIMNYLRYTSRLMYSVLHMKWGILMILLMSIYLYISLMYASGLSMSNVHKLMV